MRIFRLLSRNFLFTVIWSTILVNCKYNDHNYIYFCMKQIMSFYEKDQGVTTAAATTTTTTATTTPIPRTIISTGTVIWGSKAF